MDWRVRRIGQALFTVWGVITISFVLVRTMPGNPMSAMVVRYEEQGISPAQARHLVELRLNINPQEPIPIAYLNYMASTLQGDLGQSLYYDRPVAEILATALPWTLFVLSWAMFISFFVGIALGALMAYWEGGRLDVGLTGYATVMGSIPFYVLAILLLVVFGYRYGVFPTGGRQPTGIEPGFNWPYIRGVIHHAALPVISLLVVSGAASLSMRGNSIRVLGEDYLRVARLRGLPDSTIAVQYVARNAILPMYTGLMISIGSMFGGSIILEEVFAYRGVGYYMMSAVDQRDYPLMMGAFTIITIAVVIALLFADLTYSKIDPRAGGEGREGF
ncbi:ABC transporter permease [Natrarchaeobius sp. A-rgal3]|uniref:ABC transporter permease n=1 Tax=Natrarchaeobius versutus TaxID=1679078 RepID=UPI003510C2DF